MRILKTLILLFILCLSIQQVLKASELEHRFEIKNSHKKSFKNDSIFNPDNILLNDYPYSSFLLINADLKFHFNDSVNLTFYDTAYVSYQTAPSVDNKYNDFNKDTEDSFDYDNTLKQCYLSFNIKNRFLIDLGKKVERNGVSFYKTPSDFIIHEGETDISLSKEEQNTLLEGNVLAKFELFVTDKLFLSFVYSPENDMIGNDNEQLQGRIAYQFGTSDLDFIVYYNDYFRFGSNFSIGATDSLELHIESAVTQEMNQYFLNNNTIPSSIETQNNEYIIQSILGGHYTFANSGVLYFEYYYNQNGYTSNEWDSIINKIDSSQDLSLVFNRVTVYNANDMLQKQGGFSALRRHYLMLRYEKENLLDDFHITCTTVLGLEQLGGLLSISPSYNFNDDLKAVVDLTVFKGEEYSEFEVVVERWSTRFEIAYAF